MSINAIRAIAAAVALAFTASVAHAADSCGGGCPKLPTKARAVSTAAPTPLPAYPAPLLVATLAKGKKKTMLNVEAVLTTSALAPGAPASPAIFVDVNGTVMEPSIFGPGSPVVTDCFGVDSGGDSESRFSCTASGSWWIDIDANPGLIGAVLTVTLNGGDFLGPCVGCPSLATMTVRQTKK